MNMHYVYVLSSRIAKRIYVGFTSDLKTRFETHNSGKVKSTQAYRPWVLVYYEAYRDVHDAAKRERRLKMHAAKNELISRLEQSIKAEDGKIG
jgi:putative endonuclease